MKTTQMTQKEMDILRKQLIDFGFKTNDSKTLFKVESLMALAESGAFVMFNSDTGEVRISADRNDKNPTLDEFIARTGAEEETTAIPPRLQSHLNRVSGIMDALEHGEMDVALKIANEGLEAIAAEKAEKEESRYDGPENQVNSQKTQGRCKPSAPPIGQVESNELLDSILADVSTLDPHVVTGIIFMSLRGRSADEQRMEYDQVKAMATGQFKAAVGSQR